MDNMRRIRTFMDYLLADIGIDGKHQVYRINSIYAKIIYPVASNPLDNNKKRAYYRFRDGSNKYTMVR